MPEKSPRRVMTGEEFNELLRDAPPPTADEVSVTTDGDPGTRVRGHPVIVRLDGQLGSDWYASPNGSHR